MGAYYSALKAKSRILLAALTRKMLVPSLLSPNKIIKTLFLTLRSVFHSHLRSFGQIRPQDWDMALDWSFGLHVICVRVWVGHKDHSHKNGVSFEIQKPSEFWWKISFTIRFGGRYLTSFLYSFYIIVPTLNLRLLRIFIAKYFSS